MHSSRIDVMLVHLLIVLNAIAFCHGKSLNYRGKRSYYYPRADPLAQNDYYYPQVDGQPIYVPPVGPSASHMNDLLEEYYRRNPGYTQAWVHPTPVPYNYDNVENNYYESPVTSNSMVKNFLGDAYDNDHQGDYHILPTESHMKYEPNEHAKYEDKVNGKETKKYYKNQEEMVIESDSPKKVEKFQKTKPKLDDYDKTNIKQDAKLDATKKDKNLKYEENYESPVVHDKVNIKQDGKLDAPKKDNAKHEDKYESPVVRDKVNIKKEEKVDAPKKDNKLEYEDEYEPPVVRDKVNVKKEEKLDSPKKDNKLEYEDEYEPPVVRDKIKVKDGDKTKLPKPKQEHNDYEQPIVRDKINVKEYEDEKSYVYETESEDVDKPVVKETLKEEKIMTKQDKKGAKTSNPKAAKGAGKKYKGKRRNPSKPSKNYVGGKEDLDEVNKKIDESYGDDELKKTKTKPIKSGTKKPVKQNEVAIKTKPKETPVKTKEKVIVKPEIKETPVKTKEKVIVKPEIKETPVKTKEKVIVKPEIKETPVKIKEKVVIKSKPKETPVKSKDKVKVKPESDDEYMSKDPDYTVKEKLDAAEELPIEQLKMAEDSVHEDIEHNPAPEGELEDIDDENISDRPLKEEERNLEGVVTENKPIIGENSMNTPKFLPNEAVNRLSSLNANIWSLIFNPNAEGLKLKKCITRTNETGHCKYVQNCEVPDIAASLEQLLNNACVIDDIFIGVCCPEFPVQTVQVHWEDEISNSGKQSEAEFDQNADDCGIRSNEASKQQSWPWKAPLVSMSNGKIFCGGVIISDNYVLTAAHCTTKIPKNQILVRLGQFDDSTGDDFAVVEIKRHAQYNPRTMHNDIALLKLGRRIVRDEHTGVICLPDDDDDEDEHDGEKAILLGWKGMFGKDSKKTEFLEVMEKEDCSKKLRMNVPRTMLCTEARNENERTCNADSGAPLVIEDDGKYEVIGILSWNRNDCDQRFPSTFSRVSRFVGWIRKHAV